MTSEQKCARPQLVVNLEQCALIVETDLSKPFADLMHEAAAEITRLRTALAAAEAEKVEAFQYRVKPWMIECFGPVIPFDKQERNHRFLEEAIELVQACGCTRSEAHQLVDYVFGREIGERHQEVGGVMVTLAALCLVQSLDMAECGETELSRIWTKVEKIRAKQAAKPKHSPLPEAAAIRRGEEA